MLRPCPTKVVCLPCADDSSNPLANLSAEAPDTNIFGAINFRVVENPPPNIWTSAYCTTFCESSFSQNDADDCARRAAYRCAPEDGGCVSPPCGDPPIVPNNPIVCQDGSNFCEIAGGTVLAQSQIEADAIAQSLCNYRLNNGTCFTPTGGGGGGGGMPEPDPDCPNETGPATPITLMSPFENQWPDIVIPDPTTLDRWPGSDPDVDGPRYVIEEFDYPPGHYAIQYVSGIWKTQNETSPGLVSYGSGGFDLADDEYNCSVPEDPLAHSDGFTFLDEYNPLFPNVDDVAETDSQTFWNDPPGYRWTSVAEHTNSDIRLFLATSRYNSITCVPEFFDNLEPGAGPWIQVAGKLQRFVMLQIDGLIPQPRSLAVSGYNAGLINQFADPAAAAAWDGLIPTRITYETANPTQASWIADPNGPFGGVVLSYTSSHPTSANGRGWVLRIYSGFTVMWEGFRGVGSTPIGRFYQSAATPVGPSCLSLYDDTGRSWSPIGTFSTPPS